MRRRSAAAKPTSAAPPALARQLGVGDAVVVGLGSILGAGVFSVLAPAARAAGAALLLGLLIAAVVAYCNATSSAQLAAAYPVSGGTYVYGRERLGAWWGYAAGWGFLAGKTASCAAMALTFATYVLPSVWWAQRLVAVAAVVALAALNYRGVAKTVALTRVLVALTVIALAIVVVAVWTGGHADTDRLRGWHDVGSAGWHGTLQAAGLLFFAFAGYARIATMGEEVRDPARTIPQAIPIALLLSLGIYCAVAVSALAASGPAGLAHSAAPLASAVTAAGARAVAPAVRVGAAIASLSALLSLVAGVGRTTLAMARNHDLPAWLAAVHPRYRVPHHAEVALAIVVCLLVVTVDVRTFIGFSSFAVLVYYAIANLCAFTQPRAQRRWPRALNVLGLVGCTVLVASLPLAAIGSGVAVLLAGLLGRVIAHRPRSNRPVGSAG